MIAKSRILKIGSPDYMGRIITREAAERMVKEGNNVQNVKKLYIEGDYVVAEMIVKDDNITTV